MVSHPFPQHGLRDSSICVSEEQQSTWARRVRAGVHGAALMLGRPDISLLARTRRDPGPPVSGRLVLCPLCWEEDARLVRGSRSSWNYLGGAGARGHLGAVRCAGTCRQGSSLKLGGGVRWIVADSRAQPAHLDFILPSATWLSPVADVMWGQEVGGKSGGVVLPTPDPVYTVLL